MLVSGSLSSWATTMASLPACFQRYGVTLHFHASVRLSTLLFLDTVRKWDFEVPQAKRSLLFLDRKAPESVRSQPRNLMNNRVAELAQVLIRVRSAQALRSIEY